MASRKGFTLVELLVVVLIIAILAAIALPLYLSAVADSQVKTARANMQTIANAEQAYRVRTGVYTNSIALLSGDLGNTSGPSGPTGRAPYAIAVPGTTCTDNSQPTPVTYAGSPSFSVSDATASDGTFCPGISPN
jgi:type IV pilus assembly protein PilA